MAAESLVRIEPGLPWEIAAVFGVTESRVCQIHSQAILSLRAFLSQARNR